MSSFRRIVIISAVNLVEGGPLTILQECLNHLSNKLTDKYEIIALVNKKTLFAFDNITFLEFPYSKKNWINRLFYEYVHFKKISLKIKPFLWLSLHDITPNVIADRLAVYCHNASPFYKLSFREAIIDPKFALFNMFYKYLYKINIKKNNFLIVQQEWLRQELIKLYNVENVIVAHPKVDNKLPLEKGYDNSRNSGSFVFFYPAFPRVFKNFEVICEAVKILNVRGVKKFNIFFTFNGTENPYAKFLLRKYAAIKQIKFLGLLPRERIVEYYRNADCLIFPSKLETWGLPISEFQQLNKPMLLSDLAFAHEAAGKYDKAAFFNPDDSQQLAKLMEDFMNSKLNFSQPKLTSPNQPFAENWEQLFNILLQ